MPVLRTAVPLKLGVENLLSQSSKGSFGRAPAVRLGPFKLMILSGQIRRDSVVNAVPFRSRQMNVAAHLVSTVADRDAKGVTAAHDDPARKTAFAATGLLDLNEGGRRLGWNRVRPDFVGFGIAAIGEFDVAVANVDGANNGRLVHGEVLGTWWSRFSRAGKRQPSFNKGSKRACGFSNGLCCPLFWKISSRRRGGCRSDGLATSLRVFGGVRRWRSRWPASNGDTPSGTSNSAEEGGVRRKQGIREHVEIRIEPDGNRFLDSDLFSGSDPQQYRHLTEI
jgi:hypothetical protein